MAAPRVSVLLSVHNGEPYLAEALASLREQTLGDYELVAVDDASTDGSRNMLKGFAGGTVRVIVNPVRLGLTKSLNVGLAACGGEFIARMDADDTIAADRLERQVAFLDANPEVGVVGSWMVCEENGVLREWKAPLDHEGIVCELPFRSPLAHPTAMLRHAVIREHGIGYDESYTCSQDYDLWRRLSTVTRLANLDAFLLRYRVHGKSVSCASGNEQQRHARRVRDSLLAELGIHGKTECERHDRVANLACAGREEFLAAVDWLEALNRRNCQRDYFPRAHFARVVAGYLTALADLCCPGQEEWKRQAVQRIQTAAGVVLPDER